MAYQERDGSAFHADMDQADFSLASSVIGLSIDVNGVAPDEHMHDSYSEQSRRLPAIVASSALIDGDVHNLQDEYLGNIKELMLDMHTGKISYVLLSFGDRLSTREKFFAIPWNALLPNPVRKCFTLDVKKSRLMNEPGFDWKNLPSMADESWVSTIYEAYRT